MCTFTLLVRFPGAVDLAVTGTVLAYYLALLLTCCPPVTCTKGPQTSCYCVAGRIYCTASCVFLRMDISSAGTRADPVVHLGLRVVVVLQLPDDLFASAVCCPGDI